MPTAMAPRTISTSLMWTKIEEESAQVNSDLSSNMDFKLYGDSGAPTLLLIPGLGVSYEIFLPLVELLEVRFRIIAVAGLNWRFQAMALVLASPISFFIMLGYLPVIAKRIRNEEKVLEEGLEGYSEYKKKVKYRILPLIW